MVRHSPRLLVQSLLQVNVIGRDWARLTQEPDRRCGPGLQTGMDKTARKALSEMTGEM